MAAPRVRSLIGWCQRNGLFFGLLFLLIFFSAANGRFFTRANLSVVLLQIAIIGLIAVPGAMLILAGYIDLAVGSIAVLASVVFGELFAAGQSPGLAFVIALLVGLGWGLMSGYLITHLGFSPIIVTLGGLAGARGLAELISEGITQYAFGSGFAWLGNGRVAGLETPVWIMIGAFLIGAYVWYVTPYGRYMTAIGADRVAAGSLGVAVRRIPFLLYGASGLAAALGGLILTSQLDSSSVSIGQGLELEVLTGILLGGVSFVGGRGSLFGVLTGVLFIGVLANGLVVINISPYIQGAAIGAALFLAAALDVLYQRLDRIPVPEVEEPDTTGQRATLPGRHPA